MGKLYREFFYIPKYGKVREKVMLARVALSAVTVLGCLAALSLSAYAWFSCDVASAANTIKSADFYVNVSVTANDEPIQANTDGSYSLASGTYSVAMTKEGNAKTGFCIVDATAGNVKTTFHTQQFGVGGEENLTFTLQVDLPEAASVSFTPHWGTSRYYSNGNAPLYIADAALVSVSTGGATSSASRPQEEEDLSASAEDIQEPTLPEQAEIIHTVVEGENLTWIAERYNTTVKAIADYNGLEDISIIQIGQKLKIPPAEAAADEEGE